MKYYNKSNNNFDLLTNFISFKIESSYGLDLIQLLSLARLLVDHYFIKTNVVSKVVNVFSTLSCILFLQNITAIQPVDVLKTT